MWLQLEEKRVPYRVEKINMRWYEDDPSHHQFSAGSIDWAFARPGQLSVAADASEAHCCLHMLSVVLTVVVMVRRRKTFCA